MNDKLASNLAEAVEAGAPERQAAAHAAAKQFEEWRSANVSAVGSVLAQREAVLKALAASRQPSVK